MRSQYVRVVDGTAVQWAMLTDEEFHQKAEREVELHKTCSRRKLGVWKKATEEDKSPLWPLVEERR